MIDVMGKAGGIDAGSLAVQIQQWSTELDRLHARLAPLFRRSEPRARCLGYLRGLLGAVERKNGWQLAEHLGEATPDGVQHLLERAQWSADLARDILRDYVIEELNTAAGVLIVDETGFIKKGVHSAGVQRQYTGTAGRVENAQVGVFCCYASERGSAFIDRQLYLPQAWCEDAERCDAAGIPRDVTFLTKPRIAQAMIERALQAGVKCAWVLGDSVYGNDGRLRAWLRQRGQAYVLAVPSNEKLLQGVGRYARVDAIVQAQPARAWKRLPAGDGARGERLYDWLAVRTWRVESGDGPAPWDDRLLARRSIDTGAIAYYTVHCPSRTTLVQLAQAAGHRWHIEACFEQAKGQCGLDQYEVRRYEPWQRHITLSLLAHAALAVMRANTPRGGKKSART